MGYIEWRGAGQRKTAHFQYRFPSDLRDVVGKSKVTHSLKTSNAREAQERARPYATYYTQMVKELRALPKAAQRKVAILLRADTRRRVRLGSCSRLAACHAGLHCRLFRAARKLRSWSVIQGRIVQRNGVARLPICLGMVLIERDCGAGRVPNLARHKIHFEA